MSEVLPHRHIEWVGSDAIITIHHSTWFGFGKPKVMRYRGSGTVWRNAETGERCGTFFEGYLSDVWANGKWNKK